MTLNKLASAIAKAEGKKVEVSIGNVREILRIIVDMELADQNSDDYENSPLEAIAAAVNKKVLARSTKKKK